MDDGTRTRDGRNHNPGLYQLSYVHHRLNSGSGGAPGRNRTCNRRLRRPVLYPVELRALYKSRIYSANRNYQADARVRTNRIGSARELYRSFQPFEAPIRCATLVERSSYFVGVVRPYGLSERHVREKFRCVTYVPGRHKVNLVGAEGFEPPTLCSQSRCATRLRHAPCLPIPRAMGAQSYQVPAM